MGTTTDKPIEVIMDVLQRALVKYGVPLYQGGDILTMVRGELLPPPPHPLDSVAKWLEQSDAPAGVRKDLQWAYNMLANTNPAPSPRHDLLTPAEPVERRMAGAPLPESLFKHQNGKWYAMRRYPLGAQPVVEGVGTAPLEAIVEYVEAWQALQTAARLMVEGP